MILIDRNAVLNRFQDICMGVACMDCPFYKDGCAFEKLILDSSVVDAEPVKHGKWIYTGFMEVKCNNCGNVFHELEDTNYCPNCGCHMDDVVWGEE